MRKLVFILLGFLFFNNAVAQKTNQPYGYAFSIIIQPGTIPIDENGVPMKNKINRERFIYVMVPGKNKPTIKTISYNKTAVKWDILNVAEKEYAPVSESTQKNRASNHLKGAQCGASIFKNLLTIQYKPN